MNIEEVLTYLPHRYPFMLVDRVLDYKPGEYLDAIKNITYNEPQFTGHFPELSVMPGVLMIEALAQASGILTFKTMDIMPSKENMFFLAGVDKARYKYKVKPGDQLHLHVEILKSKRDIWKFQCKAKVGENLACSAEIIIARGAWE